MLKINKVIIDDATSDDEQLQLAEKFIKDNTPKSKDESLHAIVSVADGYMYVCNYQGDKALNLSLATNNGLIPLSRDSSEDSIKSNDIEAFLTKGENLYLFKIVHRDGMFSSIDMLSIVKEEVTLELIDTTKFEDKKSNKVLANLGVKYWKEVFALEDF